MVAVLFISEAVFWKGVSLQQMETDGACLRTKRPLGLAAHRGASGSFLTDFMFRDLRSPLGVAAGGGSDQK
jgi:hypothetical protein